MSEVNYDDYSIMNMEPSIIPTYFPGLRLWQYDVSKRSKRWRKSSDESEDGSEGVVAGEESSGEEDEDSIRFEKRKTRNDSDPLLRHVDPQSPSRFQSYLTPLGYTQYFLPLPLVNANSGYGPGRAGAALLKKHGEKGQRPPAQWEIEYTTFTSKNLARSLLGLEDQPAAIPTHLLPPSVHQLVRKYGVRGGKGALASLEKVLKGKENLISYELENLTIPEWLKLGKQLGGSEVHWKVYLKRMFVSTGIERSW